MKDPSSCDMTWPSVYQACRAALPAWDCWAGDDGRPPAALAAAWAYSTAPTLPHRAALEAALVGARDAWLNALRAEMDRLHAGMDPAPVASAQDAAFAILSLGHALLEAGRDRTNANLRNAANHAPLAARTLPPPS